MGPCSGRVGEHGTPAASRDVMAPRALTELLALEPVLTKGAESEAGVSPRLGSGQRDGGPVTSRSRQVPVGALPPPCG